MTLYLPLGAEAPTTDLPLFYQGLCLCVLALIPIILWFIDHRNQNKHEEEETAKIVHIVEQVMAHDEEQARETRKAVNDQRDDDRAAAKDNAEQVVKEVKAITSGEKPTPK